MRRRISNFFEDYERWLSPNFAINEDNLENLLDDISDQGKEPELIFRIFLEAERTKDGISREYTFSSYLNEETGVVDVTYLGYRKTA